ncbi:transglycosylase family protein [Streptomyces sp. NPDC048297]|uniref:transglycosylase family protein n=1 Tax=Streptomyces sp. NPDC048297 TaxID=3365531 RepID=UPI0037205CB6
MLPGNGRHRRPRQAPALIVAAGVTGSAIAIPLLGAVSAHAADGTTWDKVAECESGGSWSADNGNGYYGGLQISHEDWVKYGGTQYADNADRASRSQQIAVAERILADQGTTPWATCALLSGMTADSASADVDTGVGGSDSQGSGKGNSGHSSDSQSDDSGSGKKSGSPDSTDSSNSSDKSGSSSSSDSSDLSDSSDPSVGASATPSPGVGQGSGFGDAREGAGAAESDMSASPGTGASQEGEGSAASDPTLGDPGNSWQTGSSWSLVDTGALDGGGRHRGGTADESVTNGQSGHASGRHASRDADDYTVREGDTLSSIADSLDVDGGWHALYAQNKKAVGADPDDIAPGQTLHVGS